MPLTLKAVPSLLIFGVIAGVVLTACGQPDNSTLRFHAVYQDTNGNVISDATKANELPDGFRYYTEDSGGGVFVKVPAALDETCVESAYPGEHPTSSRPVLYFKFTEACTEEFTKFTADNIGRQMAIVMNGKLVSAPRINSPTSNSTFFIEGRFETVEDVEKLAATFEASD